MRTFPFHRLLNSPKSIRQKNLNRLHFLLFRIYKTPKQEGFPVQTLLFLFPFRTLIFILYPTLFVLLYGVRRAAYNTCGGRDTMRTAVVIRAYCDRRTLSLFEKTNHLCIKTARFN